MDKPDAEMPPEPQAPQTPLPAGSVDAHVHLVAGAHEFPLSAGRVENPAPGLDFSGWLDAYRAHLAAIGCTKGLIVHSILYGTDNSVTIEAVKQMGQGFKGVGLLPDNATEAQMDAFVGQNMVAVRLNYVHGGVLTWEGAKAMAPALAERGLHIQMLAHSDRHMEGIADDVRALPCPVVFDHLGWPADGLTSQSAGFQSLCALVAEGAAYAKLSAPYRMCNAPYCDADACVSALLAANPERCLWGSDWPHLMLADAKMPSAAQLADAVSRLIGDPDVRQRVFVDNPTQLFGL